MVKIVSAWLWLLVGACSVYDPGLVVLQTSNAQRGQDSNNDDAGIADSAHPDTCRRTSSHLTTQPTCVLPHAEATCVDEQCLIVRCNAPYVDCDEDASNGCEATLDSADHCGSCSNACGYAHANAACLAGHCELGSCADGFADCDADETNGCEQKVGPEGCGGCNMASEGDAPRATACAACGDSCLSAPFTASSRCGPHGCELVCADARADCDALVDNGCETAMTDAHSCGTCHNDCSRLPHVDSAGCSAGACTALVCKPGFADCDADVADGCERSTTMPSDCGACGQVCALAHAASSCTSGSCAIGHCDAGWDDCDHDPSNGCETALDTRNHCGACGTTCTGGSQCNNGACGCVTGSTSQCRAGQICCAGACADVSSTCFPYPCIPGTERAINNCGACGTICLGWCCGPLLGD
jgi:hypothetical protein